MVNYTLRQAREADLDWIVSLERREDFAPFICRWPREVHTRNLSDADMLYLLAVDPHGQNVAFVILAGLRSVARSIELVRIVVNRPGTGVGKPLLRRVINLAFNDLNANRLWLDVFDDNDRARHVYQSVGFKEEEVLREVTQKSDGRFGSLVVMSILAEDYQTG
jgi:RimJ/RimL family protein N-acetyltransferase